MAGGTERGYHPAVPTRVNIEVTTDRVVAVVLGLTVVFLGVIGVERAGVELPVLREVLAFLYLSLVPGYLLFRLLGAETDRFAETVGFVLGLSLAFLMAAGVGVNYLLPALGIPNPLTEVPLVLSLTTIVLLLTAIYATYGEEAATIRFDGESMVNPITLGLALLPFLAIFGGLLLTATGQNAPLLLLYTVIAILPVLVISDRIPDRFFAYTLWIVSVSLLLQNTLTGQYLAWGDQPKEASLALFVMQTGFWDPSLAPAFGSKFSMLRIVLLHPIYSLFTGLKLVWVFKIVHPLLFSVTPVVLYTAYDRYVDSKIAFLAAFLYISLFSFFIVLSRNTRTATAILFLALVALLVADTDRPAFQRKFMALLFVTGIIVSHYGVSYMVLAALVLVLPLRRLMEQFAPTPRSHLTSKTFVAYAVVVTFGWYIYASPAAKAFNIVVGFATNFVTRLYTEYLAAPASSSATVRYLTADFTSTTLEVIKLYNVSVGLLIVIGFVATVWKSYSGDEGIAFDSEFLAYGAVFLAVFAITFLPVERFNTARTYPTTLVFFAPFFVLGIREILGFSSKISIPEGVTVHRVATIVVVGYFVLNVGLVSATLTHEYSTNALVEKDRIMVEGHPVEKNYFYKQYPTAFGVSGTGWLVATAAENSTLYTSGWPGGLSGAVGHRTPPAERRNPNFASRSITEGMIEDGQLGEGYVFLNTYNVREYGDVIRYPSGHFQYSWDHTHEIDHAWQHKNRTYSNGGTTIYY